MTVGLLLQQEGIIITCMYSPSVAWYGVTVLLEKGDLNWQADDDFSL